jgi:hypothetical protein
MNKRYYEYDEDFFIDFFGNVDENSFSLTSSGIGLDVLSWLGPIEETAIIALTDKWGPIEDVNDGLPGWEVFGDTIQERIINFLKYVKARNANERKTA